jgi:hypothetical protein
MIFGGLHGGGGQKKTVFTPLCVFFLVEMPCGFSCFTTCSLNTLEKSMGIFTYTYCIINKKRSANFKAHSDYYLALWP